MFVNDSFIRRSITCIYKIARANFHFMPTLSSESDIASFSIKESLWKQTIY